MNSSMRLTPNEPARRRQPTDAMKHTLPRQGRRVCDLEGGVDTNVTHRDFYAELERFRDAVIDWETVINDDRQAVVVASAKLKASLISRDRALARLATLIAHHGEGLPQ
jgi:hypothetical protein